MPPNETHHLRHLIRLEADDHCRIIDGLGNEAEATVAGFLKPDRARLKIEKMLRLAGADKSLKIRVIQALTQKGKMDYLIEKAQELGVYEFLPIRTERSIAAFAEKDQMKIKGRWQRKAEEAAKQSGALRLLKIGPFQSFEQAFADRPPGEETALFHPGEESIPFKDWLGEMEKRKNENALQAVNLCFGPEGGFSEREIGWIKSQKENNKISCKMVQLGGAILKVDTAFLGVISALKLILQ